ncbi:hypothetical protein LAV72_22590 [Lysinibacillus xylanilyticus]|uniref:hypothetical protein n=1 Tax=Lysinibacillus xylanilyticus TaxID=582475 RepID=UPI002B246788|nr:hypothetical protein [Lysinibacillus xylanilyticus]MEB2302397.1 hypothetical protein [Lysinibacillus xylanilyticus]
MTKKGTTSTLFQENKSNYSFKDYFIRYSLIMCSVILGITLFTSIFQIEIFLFPIFYFGKLTIVSFIIGILAVWIHLKVYTRNKDVNRLYWIRRKKREKRPKGNIIGIGFLLMLFVSCIYMYARYGTLFFVFKRIDGDYQIESLLDSSMEQKLFTFVLAFILIGILDIAVQFLVNRYGALVLMSGIQITLLYFLYSSVFKNGLPVLDFSEYTSEDYLYLGVFILFLIIIVQFILTFIIRLINFGLYIHDRTLREV